MRYTLYFLSTIIGTLVLAFATSLLFEIPLVAAHWSRVALVLILMLLILVVGSLMTVQFAKELLKK